MPNGKKHKRHKMSTHKRKKRLRKDRHKKKKKSLIIFIYITKQYKRLRKATESAMIKKLTLKV